MGSLSLTWTKQFILIKTQIKPGIWAHLFLIPLTAAQLTFHSPHGEAAGSQESQEEKSHGWGLAELCKANVDSTLRSPFYFPHWSVHFLWWQGAFGGGVESWKVFATLMLSFLFFFKHKFLSHVHTNMIPCGLSSPRVVNVTMKPNVCSRWNAVVPFRAVGLKSDLPSQRLVSDMAQCDSKEKEMRWWRGHCGPTYLPPVTEGFYNHKSAAPGGPAWLPGKAKEHFRCPGFSCPFSSFFLLCPHSVYPLFFKLLGGVRFK